MREPEDLPIKMPRGKGQSMKLGATPTKRRGFFMFIFIIGGVRSGKSRYAVKLAKGLNLCTAYIATCVHPDQEMKARIKQHKNSRPASWTIFEEGQDIPVLLNKLKGRYKVVVIDCLGLLVSNLLAENLTDAAILRKLKRLARGLSQRPATVILVSNEVGGGIVPDNPLARRFRDLVGLANQILAEQADEVILMQAGIPMKIKEAGNG